MTVTQYLALLFGLVVILIIIIGIAAYIMANYHIPGVALIGAFLCMIIGGSVMGLIDF